MARITSFFSAVYRCRNAHSFLIKNNYRPNCVHCVELQRPIFIASSKRYCQVSSRKTVTIHDNVTVKEMSKKLHVDPSSIIDFLKDFDYDTEGGVKTVLDMDIAELIADEYGFSVSLKGSKAIEEPHLPRRPPVITIMGHVDHGKTTLLDYLRNTNVAAGEAGGITQAIGAFSVKVPGLDDSVTFVDTPGHAAFNSMRARGAQLTDIVVLVIAADDGVMEQTKECLQHIKDAGVPFIIAINKIDMPKADPGKLERELLMHSIQLDKCGGDIKSVRISALKGTNTDELLRLLNDFAKEQQFRASREEPVNAIVLESESKAKQGITASVLIKTGTLRTGKSLIAGTAIAKVRQIFDANGQVVKSAIPSDPVQIIGWRSLPIPGDDVHEVKSTAEARKRVNWLGQQSKPAKVKQAPPTKAPGKGSVPQEQKGGQNKRKPFRVTLREDAATGVNIAPNNENEVNVVIKADVIGSLEALLAILTKFHSSHVKLNVLSANVGQVSLNDFNLAQTFEGILYCFNSEPPADILENAELHGVSVRYFDVIYELLDDLKVEIETLIPPKISEHVVGQGEVLQVFKMTGKKKAVVAGCRVNEGLFDNRDETKLFKVVRDNETLHEGNLTSLKHRTNDVLTVKESTECGLIFKNFVDFQPGDKIQCLWKENIKRTIDWKL